MLDERIRLNAEFRTWPQFVEAFKAWCIVHTECFESILHKVEDHTDESLKNDFPYKSVLFVCSASKDDANCCVSLSVELQSTTDAYLGYVITSFSTLHCDHAPTTAYDTRRFVHFLTENSSKMCFGDNDLSDDDDDDDDDLVDINFKELVENFDYNNLLKYGGTYHNNAKSGNFKSTFVQTQPDLKENLPKMSPISQVEDITVKVTDSYFALSTIMRICRTVDSSSPQNRLAAFQALERHLFGPGGFLSSPNSAFEVLPQPLPEPREARRALIRQAARAFVHHPYERQLPQAALQAHIPAHIRQNVAPPPARRANESPALKEQQLREQHAQQPDLPQQTEYYLPPHLYE